jgi:hypothetical protein
LGKEYRWEDKSLFDVAPENLPVISDWLAKLTNQFFFREAEVDEPAPEFVDAQETEAWARARLIVQKHNKKKMEDFDISDWVDV